MIMLKVSENQGFALHRDAFFEILTFSLGQLKVLETLWILNLKHLGNWDLKTWTLAHFRHLSTRGTWSLGLLMHWRVFDLADCMVLLGTILRTNLGAILLNIVKGKKLRKHDAKRKKDN